MLEISSSQLQKLRTQLQIDQQEIQRRLEDNEHYGLADSQREATSELSSNDNHPGDTASELYERGKDIALHEQDELHLERITAALAAMDKGTYGICQTCGISIPVERLEAVPDTIYCISHSPRQHVSNDRPVEEDFLEHPFGRTSMDEKDFTGFDGEDAWQIVEQWGNSDSPAMSEKRDAADYNHIGIESDENDGYAEPIESFLATDITGSHAFVVRNQEYNQYMQSGEGDHGLEEQPNDLQ